MPLLPLRRWLLPASALGLILIVYVGNSLWRASRALHESFDLTASREAIQFTSTYLERPVPASFEWIGSSAVYTDLAEFRGRIYLCGPAGLFEHDSSGAPVAAYRTGLELPPSPPTKLAVGVVAGTNEPELFVATAGEGLLAFDGRAFRHIRPAGNPFRKLTAILPVSSGRLLMGTEKEGLLVYDGTKITAFHPRLSRLQITALAGSESNLWVGTLDRGVYHWYAGQADQFGEQEGLPDQQVLSIAVTEEATYVGTPMGVAEFRDGRFSRTLASGFFARKLFAQHDRLQVGTLDEGLLEVPLTVNAPRSLRSSPEPFPTRIESLLDIQGELYALAEDGLYAVDARTRGWRKVVSPKNGMLSDRNISALHIDAAGRVWAGFFDRGLDILDMARDRSTHFENEHVFCVNRIAHDPDGDIVAVATANGLVLFDSEGRLRQVLGRAEGLIADHITDVLLGPGSMTVATPAGLTFIDRDGMRSLYAFHGLVNNHVYALARSGERLLVGTLGGLSVLEGDQIRASYSTANSDLKHNWISAIVRVGEEWFVGTYGSGILRLDNAGYWQTFPDATAPFEVNPNAMLATGNRVYAGTLDRGLYVYDQASMRWSVITSGLPSTNVTAIAARGDQIYVGTDNGIVRFREGSVMVQ